MGCTVLPPVPTFRRQLRTPAEQACVEQKTLLVRRDVVIFLDALICNLENLERHCDLLCGGSFWCNGGGVPGGYYCLLLLKRSAPGWI